MDGVLRADAMLTPDGPVWDAELEIGGDGRIAYAGAARRGSRVSLDLPGHVLMPGLVNGHTHSAMTLMRGASDDDGFLPWLGAVQALEQRLTHADVAAGLELALLEMIASGTTAFADMYHWDAELVELVRASGLRVNAAPAAFAPGTRGFPGVSPWTGADVLGATEALATRYAGDPQVRVSYGPHAPYTCPPEFLREIAERSARTGIPIHIHVAESIAEVADIRERTSATPVAHLHALGLFEGPVLVAHGVHLTPGDIALLARAGAAVSHNPVSNLKLGCGIAPLPELRDAGIALALGTDSAASNNSLDLFEEIKTATILHRGARQDAGTVRAAEVLDLATRRGAAAIGFPESGALAAGRHADVIALDVSRAGAIPHASLVSHLAFAARGSDVRHVIIGGRPVYAEGRFLTLDAPGILARASAAAARLRAGSG